MVPTRSEAPAPFLLLILVLVQISGPAHAAIAFREIEVIESSIPGESARVVRQFQGKGVNARILFEESTDQLTPPGSYLLWHDGETWIVDPGRRTLTPLDPVEIEPVAPGRGELPGGAQGSGLILERQLDEAGPPMLGLATRHYRYVLRYEEAAPAPGAAPTRVEEDHEFWAAAIPGAEPALAAWQTDRTIEDAAPGPARQEISEALGRMRVHGFFMKQIIERHDNSSPTSGSPQARSANTERIVREVTALSRDDFPDSVFDRPVGYEGAGILIPMREEPVDEPSRTPPRE